MRNNALWNCQDPYQGSYKRVLTVCSAGLLRSPTIAWVLSNNTDYNCRAAGIHDYALVQVDPVLIKWADIIICAETSIKDYIVREYGDVLDHRVIYDLEIPDNFAYRDPELIKIINERLKETDLVDTKSESL